MDEFDENRFPTKPLKWHFSLFWALDGPSALEPDSAKKGSKNLTFGIAPESGVSRGNSGQLIDFVWLERVSSMSCGLNWRFGAVTSLSRYLCRGAKIAISRFLKMALLGVARM